MWSVLKISLLLRIVDTLKTSITLIQHASLRQLLMWLLHLSLYFFAHSLVYFLFLKYKLIQEYSRLAHYFFHSIQRSHYYMLNRCLLNKWMTTSPPLALFTDISLSSWIIFLFTKSKTKNVHSFLKSDSIYILIPNTIMNVTLR